jgi:3',5'-cyclic AMP phosphodiesterase CpdA
LSPFRLAHLSDPHLPLAVPRGWEVFGKRGLSAISWHRRRSKRHLSGVAATLTAHMLEAKPDVIAVTGDVVNFALPREFAASKTWLEQLGPPERVLVIPGNHEALAGNWQRSMAQAWGPYAAPLPRMTRHGPIGLVQLSTACVTPPFLASGRLDQPNQASLLIAEAEAAGLLPIVLMHHPPTALTSKRKGLADLPMVQAALKGAALVLHGHTHQSKLSYFPGAYGTVPVLGIPSLSMKPDVKLRESSDLEASQTAGAWRMLEFSGRQVTVTEYALQSDRTVAARPPICLTLPCRP